MVSAALLLGCATFNPFQAVANPVNATNLYQAELGYDAAIKTFNELKALCINHTLPRVCRTYVVQGQNIIRKADAARAAAEKFVGANPSLDATNVIQAFTGLVANFKAKLDKLSATKV